VSSPFPEVVEAAPRLALVLGAGGARGLAHIGVLKVFEDHRLPIDLVVGASMGSLAGAAYAAGLPMERVERLVLEARPWRMLRARLGSAGLLDPSGLALVLAQALGKASFADLRLPFAAVATSLRHGRLVLLRDGPLVPALMAAITVPMVFPPARLGDDLLVDGGLLDGLPVAAARSLGARRVVAVDADIHAPRPFRGRRVGALAARLRDRLLHCPLDRASSRLVLGRLLQCILARRQPSQAPDVLIQPPFGRIMSNHFHRRAHCIALGERAARQALPQILKLAGET
jgi:NTE family protein